MKKIKSYTDKEITKITLEYNKEIYEAARTLYSIMPWQYTTCIKAIINYITNPLQTSILDAQTEELDDETYEKYFFWKELLSINNPKKLSKMIDIDKIQNFTIKRIKKLKTIRKKLYMDNLVFYAKIYGPQSKLSYEELKNVYRTDDMKKRLKAEFLNYIKYTDINKQKQSKRYTVSRDLDKDIYYETTEGKLARIKINLFNKYKKKGLIDDRYKACNALQEGIYAKPMKLINKTLPKASESMKMLLAGLFEGIKECHMVIDTDFKKAYNPGYNTHQDTDGDKASNYSCMSGEGLRAQEFYGKIHGCKVVRWETDDGEQVGRCIMYEWNGQRHFIRIYGLYEYHRTMINMLEAQMNVNDLFGRNIAIKDIKLKTDIDGDTECMYLDGNRYGLKEINGEFYMVADKYDCDCKTTGGETIEGLIENTSVCEHCGERCENDEGYWIDDYFYCCTDCAAADGYYQCERCGEWKHEDDCIWIEGVGYYCCEGCAENAGYGYDNYNNEWTDNGDLGETKDGRYRTTREGAADYYNVDEDQVEWDSENCCWKNLEEETEQEKQNEGEEND